MNKDGLPDVVLGNDGQVNQVSLNRGFDYTGPFQISSGVAVGTETGTAWAVAGADLNGDGHQDLISGNYNRFSQVFLGDGTGDFTHAVGTNIGLSASVWVRSIAVADLNSDGKLDIVLGDLAIVLPFLSQYLDISQESFENDRRSCHRRFGNKLGEERRWPSGICHSRSRLTRFVSRTASRGRVSGTLWC